ncbi:phosphoethanolamine transferase [Solimonas terrae]|uniref:Phosphoethanolamine transferase n=1 Tax=Solimonas terrae TaxID=1396819 RepID=A0A6M2BSH6_9GAMM|nr:sulfatase-like hydrolase/transferase [Solimonas terrae]NGY05582.1 phosphoethanolamine transferase [Solimonas terrae]
MTSMATRLYRKYNISHAAFCVVYPATLYVGCNAINIDKIARWFPARSGVDYLPLAAYLLAGLCLFTAFFTLLAHRWTIKPVAIVLTVASAVATYFIAKYNVAIDSSMVQNVWHTDRTEVGQLLSPQMIPYAVFLVFVPVLIVLRADIGFPSSGRYLIASLMIVGISLPLATACLYLNRNPIQRAGNVSRKYIVYSLVPVNVVSGAIGAAGKALAPYLSFHRAPPTFSATVASPGNLVVVLAIGESSRQKNFGIYGYQRNDTTPTLRQVNGLHVLNGVARIGSTLYALPEILRKNRVTLPEIVSKAGIPTACYVNYTLYDNCASVGETPVDHCGHGGHCYDEDVIPMLANRLQTYRSGYSFVVLHLGGGSHGPVYRDRIPPEYQRFEPTCNDADIADKCSLAQIYNSYDNTILYVDHVVGEIIHTLDRSGAPYVFLYLSDHGESLMENGVMFHGMPPGVSLPEEQAHIPLIVKASVPIDIVDRVEYHQPDVFDTVLDLFSIRSDLFDRADSFVKIAPQP